MSIEKEENEKENRTEFAKTSVRRLVKNICTSMCDLLKPNGNIEWKNEFKTNENKK